MKVCSRTPINNNTVCPQYAVVPPRPRLLTSILTGSKFFAPIDLCSDFSAFQLIRSASIFLFSGGEDDNKHGEQCPKVSQKAHLLFISLENLL